MEWSNANKYNSFNSFKGLVYYDHYKKIVAWMNGADYLPPPIEVNLDPFAECNLACYFCVTQRYLRAHREEVGPMRSLPTDYMIRLVDFLAGWGVPGLCISGGGEPTLYKGVPEVIHRAADKGMDVALVSNMADISTSIEEAMMRCRWVAMSIDSATPETYQKVKGRHRFDDVVRNIERVANARQRTGAKVDLCFKMVVLPENVKEIHTACILTKNLGVQDFHVRPVDLERNDIEGHRKLNLDMKEIEEQFARCHEEETDTFHVYTVTHKFDLEFHNKQDFKRCLMTPILLPILTDGNAYLCVDKKMQAKYRLGSCFPDPENILKWWGSDAHRELVKSVVPTRDCADCRCTGSQYNQQIEQCVIEDRLCRSFP